MVKLQQIECDYITELNDVVMGDDECVLNEPVRYNLTANEFTAMIEFSNNSLLEKLMREGKGGRIVETIKSFINSAIIKMSKERMMLDVVHMTFEQPIHTVNMFHGITWTSTVEHHLSASQPTQLRWKEESNTLFADVILHEKITRGACMDMFIGMDGVYALHSGLTLKIIDFYLTSTGHPVVVLIDEVNDDERCLTNRGPSYKDAWGETRDMYDLLMLNINDAIITLERMTIEDLFTENIYFRTAFMYPIMRRKTKHVIRLYTRMFELHPTYINKFLTYYTASAATLISLSSSHPELTLFFDDVRD
jgi:hypothetical protein